MKLDETHDEYLDRLRQRAGLPGRITDPSILARVAQIAQPVSVQR